MKINIQLQCEAKVEFDLTEFSKDCSIMIFDSYDYKKEKRMRGEEMK